MKLNNLCLYRSEQIILDDINVDLPECGVTVVLGANGAGKSTFLNALAGVSQIDTGQIEMGSLNTAFLMPEPAAFYPQLDVIEQLSLVAHLNHIVDVKAVIGDAIELWGLTEVSSKLTKHLSLGFRQRLSLAQLMVSDCDLLLLDEPMNGMDPPILNVFKEQINSWKKTKCIIMATHIMHEAQDMADWVMVMNQGKVMYSKAYNGGESFHEIYQQALMPKPDSQHCLENS